MTVHACGDPISVPPSGVDTRATVDSVHCSVSTPCSTMFTNLSG
ncbi:hypothetical protein [Actinophytocola xanthii]|nr:hypothetical protein [Actinophytocola xanthii]